MVNLTRLFKVGQKVRVRSDGDMHNGVIKEVYEKVMIIDVEGVSDHCWYEVGLNLDNVYSEVQIDMKKIEKGKYHYKGMLITRKEKNIPYLNRNGKLKTAKESFWAVYEMGNFIGSADTLEEAKKIIEEVQE